MALINCSECGREISSQARVCPSCGAPMTLSTVTTEKTSKEVKLEQLKAFGVLVAGAIITVVGGSSSTDNKTMIFGGIVLLLIGIILLIKVSVKNWWNHG